MTVKKEKNILIVFRSGCIMIVQYGYLRYFCEYPLNENSSEQEKNYERIQADFFGCREYDFCKKRGWGLFIAFPDGCV